MEKKDFIPGKIYHTGRALNCAKWYYIGPDPFDHNKGYFKLVGIEKETVILKAKLFVVKEVLWEEGDGIE